MSRALAAALALLAGAPLQCPSRAPPELAREDSPAEALWGLAERFGRDGDLRARGATLRHLVERYPASRFAERARLALADGGAP